MALTETKLKNSKPRERRYKLSDGQGLTLIVNPTGSRLWRFRYRFQGAEKMLSLGRYPATSLKAARQKRDDARRLLEQDVDPSAQRKAHKNARGGHSSESCSG